MIGTPQLASRHSHRPSKARDLMFSAETEAADTDDASAWVLEVTNLGPAGDPWAFWVAVMSPDVMGSGGIGIGSGAGDVDGNWNRVGDHVTHGREAREGGEF